MTLPTRRWNQRRFALAVPPSRLTSHVRRGSAELFVNLRAQRAILKTLKVFCHSSPGLARSPVPASLPWVNRPHNYLPLPARHERGEGWGEGPSVQLTTPTSCIKSAPWRRRRDCASV